MKIQRLFLAAVGATFCMSCAKELPPINEISEANLTKIVNSYENSDENSIILKIEGEVNSELLAELSASGIENIYKVFESTPGKEALEKLFNMDKWYIANLADGIDNVKAAQLSSCIKSISKVQYNNIAKKASDCISYPSRGNVVATKASNTQFNDPQFLDQWHYINNGSKSISMQAYAGADINVKDVWANLTCGDPSVIVAVIDEGVKYTHPDLAANMWTGPNGEHGKNFITGGDITWNKTNDSGHGTHCAGTIAAVNNNGLGVCGVAGGTGKGDGVKIMSCQIFDGGYGGTTSVTAQAIKYAADNGASIISCSFGYAGSSAYKNDADFRKSAGVEYEAIRYFQATKNNKAIDGGIVIFASGNDATPYASYPGAYNDIICVSAFGPDYLPGYYTNYGPGCNIVAPGGEAYHLNNKDNYLIYGMVLSTLPSEVNDGEHYGYMQGTSMACPHVSGIAALGISYALKMGKTFTVKEFEDMIVSSANDIDSRLNGNKDYLYNQASIPLYKYRKMLGTGAIDAWQLMMKIEGIPSLIAETGKKQWLDIGSYFGTAATNLTYLDIEVSEADSASLGLVEKPYIEFGRLFIHPTKPGSCKIKVSAVAGGEQVGDDNTIGGMEISQEISVVARNFKSTSGGWL